MTFLTELERLKGAATKGPWAVDPDDRPNMDWNNHIVVDGLPWTVCFMAHEPKDNDGQRAAAELIVLLRNHADALAGLVRAAEIMSRAVDTGERNEDGAQRGVRMPEKYHVDELRNALDKLNGAEK